MKFFITMRQINLEKKSEPFAERSHQEAIIEQLSLQNRKTCLRVRKDIQQRKVARRNTKNGGLKSAFKASKEAVYTSILQWLLSNETYPDFTPYFLSFHAKSNSQKQRPKKSSSILKKKKIAKGISISSSHLKSFIARNSLLSLSHQLDQLHSSTIF